MTTGHREAQQIIQHLGQALGFAVQRQHSRESPTDGVWYPQTNFVPLKRRPVLAVEVVVSEGKKGINGSVSVLEQVSPSLGIVVVQNEEIERRWLESGRSKEEVSAELRRVVQLVRDAASRSNQRIEVWTMTDLRAHLQRAELGMVN